MALRERLHTLKVFTKYQCFYLNYHTISIKSYVVDVYMNCLSEVILIHTHNIWFYGETLKIIIFHFDSKPRFLPFYYMLGANRGSLLYRDVSWWDSFRFWRNSYIYSFIVTNMNQSENHLMWSLLIHNVSSEDPSCLFWHLLSHYLEMQFAKLSSNILLRHLTWWNSFPINMNRCALKYSEIKFKIMGDNKISGYGCDKIYWCSTFRIIFRCAYSKIEILKIGDKNL